MSILQTAIGETLPPLHKAPITQEQLRHYAEASGDYNPIHLDAEAARRVGLDGVIAHGMLSMAFLGQFITQQLNDIPDAYVKHLRVRFASMVRPGDSLQCEGVVTARNTLADGSLDLVIDCWVQNRAGEKVTAGEAIVSIPLTQK